jgi:hypothetical protein
MLILKVTDFDYEFESKEEECIRMQLESHLSKKKIPTLMEQNKTKWSDKDEDIEDDSKLSPAKVVLQEGTINSLVKYTNNWSSMKMRKKIGLRRFGSAEYTTSVKATEHLEFYEKTFTQLNNPLNMARTYTYKKPTIKAQKLEEL